MHAFVFSASQCRLSCWFFSIDPQFDFVRFRFWFLNRSLPFVWCKMQCKRCGQFGHMMKTCNETVYDSDAPPPALPKPKTKKNKKAKAASIASTKQSQAGACSITITAAPLLSKSPAVNTKSKRGRRKKTSVGEGVTGYGRLFFFDQHYGRLGWVQRSR